MGIQGLLPVVKSITTPVHIRDYAGKKAAIDTYSWLHKASYTCSKDVCEGRLADKLVDYCMHRVNLLRYFGVKPLLVFDGGVLPMKAEQESKRARSRNENLERAQEHERLGNHAAAYECYQKAVDITPALAAKFIKVLQRERVEYVVAPYEADAQMAYLAHRGLVDVVITEDSDLIAYGCPRVLFKMDRMGQGDEFVYSELVRSRDLNFSNFTQQMVLEMCVMTGCDYLNSLPGMGVKKAHGLMRRFKSYMKVLRHLRFSGVTISEQYEERFERALLTFHHQRVYDPVHHRMVHLTDVPDDLTMELDFVGPALPQDLVKAIAEGEVDPCTRLPFENPEMVLAPVGPAPPRQSGRIISSHFTRKRLEVPAQKNVLTNYFNNRGVEKQFKAPRLLSKSEQEQKELKDRHARDSPCVLTHVSEDLSLVFGSPLPDDDDDDIDSAADGNSADNGSVLESQEAYSTNDKLFPAGGARRLSAMERDADSVVDTPRPKLSSYFRSPKTELHCQGKHFSASQTDPQLELASYRLEAGKKTKVTFHEVDIREEDPIQDIPVVRVCTREVSHEMVQHSGVRTFKTGADGCDSELGKFAADISYLDQYSRIAKSSVDKFSQTIAPFRCSSGKGARASGLRAPMKSISTNASKGGVGRGQSTLEDCLKQFSYQPSAFTPPSQSLPTSHSSLVTPHFVKDQGGMGSTNWS